MSVPATSTETAGFMPVAGPHLLNPYPFYARARGENPVFFSPAFNMWFVTRYDDVMRILRDPAGFSSKDTIPSHPDMAPAVAEALAGYRHPTHLLNTDPPEHTRLRSILNHGFAARRMAQLEPMVGEVASSLIAGFEQEGSVDLVSRFAYPFPLTVILRMLGIPDEDLDKCRQWSRDITDWAFGQAVLPPGRLVECAHGMVAFQGYTERLIAERSAHPREDIISHLLGAREDGVEPLAVEELVSLIPGFVLAGHETSAGLIANSMLLVLQDGGVWRRMGGNPEVVAGVVEESLRMLTSVLGMIRTSTRAASVGGVEIPADTRLFLLYGSANHDPSVFSDPEEFQLDRGRTAHHLGFGWGVHFCIGAALARLEATVALAMLRERLPGLRITPGQALERRPNLLFPNLVSLRLEWS